MECKYVIDRIEGDLAVCETEDCTIVNIPLSEIGVAVKEGQTLIKNDEGYRTEETDSAEVKDLFNKLFKKGR